MPEIMKLSANIIINWNNFLNPCNCVQIIINVWNSVQIISIR